MFYLANSIISINKRLTFSGKTTKKSHLYIILQEKKQNQKEYTLMEQRVTEKRNWRINDIINKAARQLINIAIKKQVSEIIIGYNKGFKTKGIKSDLPNKEKSRINQNFIQLPISKFKNKIKELCSRYNIKYMEINESYTSICSFYDNEEIKYHRNYLGKRMTRSLFKTKEGKIINADINEFYKNKYINTCT